MVGVVGDGLGNPFLAAFSRVFGGAMTCSHVPTNDAKCWICDFQVVGSLGVPQPTKGNSRVLLVVFHSMQKSFRVYGRINVCIECSLLPLHLGRGRVFTVEDFNLS